MSGFEPEASLFSGGPSVGGIEPLASEAARRSAPPPPPGPHVAAPLGASAAPIPGPGDAVWLSPTPTAPGPATATALGPTTAVPRAGTEAVAGIATTVASTDDPHPPTPLLVEYYHTDAVGSVRVVTKVVNGQMVIVSRHDLMPFGEEVNPPSPPTDKRLFTGQERDFETGLDYFNARQLATGYGRFTTVDPLGEGYGYALNNPLRFVDPDGRNASEFAALAALFLLPPWLLTPVATFKTTNEPFQLGAPFEMGGLQLDARLAGGWPEPPRAQVDAGGGGVAPQVKPAVAANNGSCLPNVGAFVTQFMPDAQTLADQLGNGVTAQEVLATAGNETGFGGGFAKIGNYFGIHGSGPDGTYYTTDNHTPVARFPVSNGFLLSGQVFVGLVKPYMSPQVAAEPLRFFTVLNQHGYATRNPHYPRYMVQTGKKRGPYTLVGACMNQ